MLDGVNDEEQHAHELGKLLETLQVVSFAFNMTYEAFTSITYFFYCCYFLCFSVPIVIITAISKFLTEITL